MKFPIQIRSILIGQKVVEIEFLAFQNITSKGCNSLKSKSYMSHMRIEIATRGNVFAEATQHLQQQMSTRGILKIHILSILSRTHTFDLQHEG